MTAPDCGSVRRALGVYVLGALEPHERSEIDRHLSGCAACREELAPLASLPALLHRIPVHEAERLAAGDTPDASGPPAEHLLPGVLSRAAAARRRQVRRQLAALAAAVVLVLGGAAGGVLAAGGGGAPAPRAGLSAGAAGGGADWHAVRGVSPATGVQLTVRYLPTAWGTRMSIRADGVAAGTICGFEVIDRAGQAYPVGSWRATYGGASTWYPASTSLPVSGLRGFALVVGKTVLADAWLR